jgi:hypothetical protein
MKQADMLIEEQQDMRGVPGYAPLADEYQKHTPHHFVVPSSDRGELSEKTRCAIVGCGLFVLNTVVRCRFCVVRKLQKI